MTRTKQASEARIPLQSRIYDLLTEPMPFPQILAKCHGRTSKQVQAAITSLCHEQKLRKCGEITVGPKRSHVGIYERKPKLDANLLARCWVGVQA